MRADLVVAAVCLALLTGCAKLPFFKTPATDVPAAWKDAPKQGEIARGERWWTLYGDAQLEKLIEEGLANNRDLAIAAARIEEAQSLLRITDADRAPGAALNAQRDRSRSSARTQLLPPGVPLVRNNNRIALDFGYELDLWGRLRGASNAARADLLATESARRTISLTLVNQIVDNYYGLLALDMQLAATRRSLELRGRDFELQRIRYDAGLIGNFNLRQLEAEVAAARAQLPVLQQRRLAGEVALVTLLGRSPRAMVDAPLILGPDNGQLAIDVVPAGLPSDLLLRRPDIIEAEQRLAAANARVGVARASLFPRITLTGLLGVESTSLSDLFSAPARIWQLAFGLAQPIFQGGRLGAEVDLVRARERQALAQYQRTVENAFGEVREALSAQTRAREAHAAESERVTALSDTLRLARIRFENGLSSQLEVLDAERNLLQAELNRADALRAQRAAVADLVRALGGGWTDAALPPAGPRG